MNKNKGIVLYLHVHQPWRIREYSIFDVARMSDYFLNRDFISRMVFI
jgi:alpha-amylase